MVIENCSMGGGVYGIVSTFIFLIVIFVLGYLFVRYNKDKVINNTSDMDILDKWYASGKITKEEFSKLNGKIR